MLLAFGDNMKRANQNNLKYLVTGIVVGGLLVYVVFIHEWGSPEDTPVESSKTNSGSDKSDDIGISTEAAIQSHLR